MPEQECLRCGFIFEVNSMRKPNTICQSCRARKAQKVGDCIVWHGHFAPDMVTPVDDEGNIVLRGKRQCGKLDCVNPKHLERNEH